MDNHHYYIYLIKNSTLIISVHINIDELYEFQICLNLIKTIL